MRLFTYHTYASYCEKLRRRIVGPCLKRYQEKDLLQLIAESKGKKNQKKEKEIFKQVSHVREFNMESLVENEYIIKELSKQQKLMDTRRIIGLDKETMDKVDTIHQFICDTGTRLKVGEVMEYVSHLADIERRLPGNVIHKIMFI